MSLSSPSHLPKPPASQVFSLKKTVTLLPPAARRAGASITELLTQHPPSFSDTQLGSQPTTSVGEAINQRRPQPRVRSGQLADGIRVTNGKWGVYISFGSDAKRKNAGIQPLDKLNTNTSWVSNYGLKILQEGLKWNLPGTVWLTWAALPRSGEVGCTGYMRYNCTWGSFVDMTWYPLPCRNCHGANAPLHSSAIPPP